VKAMFELFIVSIIARFSAASCMSIIFQCNKEHDVTSMALLNSCVLM